MFSSAATPSTEAAPHTRLPAAEPAAAQVPARAPSASEVRRTTNVSGPGTTTARAATARKLRNVSMAVMVLARFFQHKRCFLDRIVQRYWNAARSPPPRCPSRVRRSGDNRARRRGTLVHAVRRVPATLPAPAGERRGAVSPGRAAARTDRRGADARGPRRRAPGPARAGRGRVAQAAGDIRGTVRVAAFQTAARALGLPAIDRLAGSASGPADGARGAGGGGVAAARRPRRDRAGDRRGVRARAAPARRRARARPISIPTRWCSRSPRHTRRPLATRCRSRRCATSRGRPGTRGPPSRTWSRGSAVPSAAFQPDVRHRVSDMDLLLGLVAGERTAALVPMLGRPEREPGVALRRIAEGSFRRALFVAVRASDRARPATARPPRWRRSRTRRVRSAGRRLPRPPDPAQHQVPVRGRVPGKHIDVDPRDDRDRDRDRRHRARREARSCATARNPDRNSRALRDARSRAERGVPVEAGETLAADEQRS